MIFNLRIPFFSKSQVVHYVDIYTSHWETTILEITTNLFYGIRTMFLGFGHMD